jgi:hypothetical protein
MDALPDVSVPPSLLGPSTVAGKLDDIPLPEASASRLEGVCVGVVVDSSVSDPASAFVTDAVVPSSPHAEIHANAPKVSTPVLMLAGCNARESKSTATPAKARHRR